MAERGPWTITKVEPEGPYDPQALTWKQLVAHVAHNLGHLALALYEVARKGSGEAPPAVNYYSGPGESEVRLAIYPTEGAQDG